MKLTESQIKQIVLRTVARLNEVRSTDVSNLASPVLRDFFGFVRESFEEFYARDEADKKEVVKGYFKQLFKPMEDFDFYSLPEPGQIPIWDFFNKHLAQTGLSIEKIKASGLHPDEVEEEVSRKFNSFAENIYSDLQMLARGPALGIGTDKQRLAKVRRALFNR